MYEGRYYSVGATITDHGTYGIACGQKPEKTTDLSQVTEKLDHKMLKSSTPRHEQDSNLQL
jgi:hypothetical protein